LDGPAVAQPYPSGARDAQVMDLSLRSVNGVFAGYVIDLVLLARTIRAQPIDGHVDFIC
jgi:hypothetical protein